MVWGKGAAGRGNARPQPNLCPSLSSGVSGRTLNPGEGGMAEAAGSLPSCGTAAETGRPLQLPSLRSVWGRGSEPVGQDEAPALGWLQPAAAPGSRAPCSQAVCGCCGGHPTPQPMAHSSSGHLWLLTRCVHGAPPAPSPGARSPLLLGLAVQRAPQCPACGPARGGLLHDETARSGVGGGTGRSFCRRPSRHGHVQPARSQVRAGHGAREAGALLWPAGMALIPREECWSIGNCLPAFPGHALSPDSDRARSGPSRRW